jgi:hypothetical protein
MATMREECIPIERIEAVAALPETDPRRRHLESCPRCRAHWAELQDFMRLGAAPAEARPAEARERLQHWLDSELLARPAARHPAEHRSPRPWRPWEWPAVLRLAAAAAAVIVVGAVWTWQRASAPVPGAALRGGGDATTGTASRDSIALALDPASHPGDVRLRWNAVAGAEAYEVTLHAADLSVIGRIDAHGGTGCALPDSLRGATLARVRALRGGDEFARSSFLRLPPAGR